MAHRLHRGGKPRGSPPNLVNSFFPTFNSSILFSCNLLSGNSFSSLANNGESSRGCGSDGLTATMSSQRVSNHSVKCAGQVRKEPVTQTVRVCHYTTALPQDLATSQAIFLVEEVSNITGKNTGNYEVYELVDTEEDPDEEESVDQAIFEEMMKKYDE